jgi:hypothetical protein
VVTGLAVADPELPALAELPPVEAAPLDELELATWPLVECAASAGSWPETSWAKMAIHTATNTAVDTAMNRLRSPAIRARRAASFEVRSGLG